MSSKYLLETFDDKSIINDEEIDEDIFNLELEEYFNDINLSDSYEDLLDTIIKKAKDISDGKYTLEELLKIEPDLDKFIPSDISQEDIYNVVNNKIEIIKIQKLLNFDNDEKINFSLEEEKSKLNEIYENVDSKIREIVGKISLVEAVFGAIILRKLNRRLKELKDFKNAKSLLWFVIKIFIIVKIYQFLKHDHDRQLKILVVGSKTNYEPNKKVRLLSKAKLDNNIKIYNKLMKSADKLLNDKTISSTDNMINALKSVGINVTTKGHIDNESKIRTRARLIEHGYGIDDFIKYRDIHRNIIDNQKEFTEELIKSKGLSILGTSELNIDRKALRILTRIIRRVSKRTLYEIFVTTKALGRLGR